MTIEKLNFHLLTTLGLSHDSAEIVIDRITELERERRELAAWKESALLVESRWDCQKVAKLLGITLGHDIRPNIEPKILALLETLNDRDETIKRWETQWSDLRAKLADPVALRANILRHGPPGFDLYSAEHIERIKAEAIAAKIEAIAELEAELNVAGLPVGNEHGSYSTKERIQHLAAQRDYYMKQTDKLREKLAAGDCKDSAADNEILRAELRRLLVDECVSRSDADRIAEALRAIE